MLNRSFSDSEFKISVINHAIRYIVQLFSVDTHNQLQHGISARPAPIHLVLLETLVATAFLEPVRHTCGGGVVG